MRVWALSVVTLLIIYSAHGQEENSGIASIKAAAEKLEKMKQDAGQEHPTPKRQIAAEQTAAKEAALAEGAKLREQARKRAAQRIKAQKEGSPPPPTETETKKPDLVDREAAREFQKEEKRQARVRALSEHQQEKVRLSKIDDPTGRRILAEMQPTPHCADGEKNDAETDVDCGGDSCRDEIYLDHGLELPRRCNFAQSCHVNSDCSSGSCANQKCGPVPALTVPGGAIGLKRALHRAFFRIADERYDGKYITGGDLGQFISLAVNPDAQTLTETQQERFDAAVEYFAKEQGLASDPSIQVLYGFLTRGRPLELVRSLVNPSKLKQEL